MDSKDIPKKVGVIGAGSFGTALSNILAKNAEVILYARSKEVVDQISNSNTHLGYQLADNISATDDLQYLAESCNIIFPVVPSQNFRAMIQQLAPYLHPYHILIHATKGFDIIVPDEALKSGSVQLQREHVKTMSELIVDESVVVRVGCLAGPNLAKELLNNKPAATVVASHFEEVILAGQKLLRSDSFQVYGSSDLIGIELCGILKNIIAIASGAIGGLDLGENARGLLISRGMVEMIYLGRAFGGNTKAFIGLAGVGDLVTTSTSTLSRNYTVGYRLAKGESLTEIISSMDEVAEGVKTVEIVKSLANYHNVRAPITEILYKIMFGDLTVKEAVGSLMKFPLNVDIDFLE